jgi:hypothetical protein
MIPTDKRVTAGWVVSPLVSIAFWRHEFFLVVPASYVALLVLGLPAFRFCVARRWLQWWHALTAGWLAGVVVAVAYLLAVDAYHAEINAPNTLIFLPGYGGVVGLLFWLIAIYRNPRFPQRPTNWISLVLVISVFGLFEWAGMDRFEISEIYGSVAGKPSDGFIRFDLNDGSHAKARVMRFRDEAPQPPRGTVGTYSRLSAVSGERLYWISGICRDPIDSRMNVCEFDPASQVPPPIQPSGSTSSK